MCMKICRHILHILLVDYVMLVLLLYETTLTALVLPGQTGLTVLNNTLDVHCLISLSGLLSYHMVYTVHVSSEIEQRKWMVHLFTCWQSTEWPRVHCWENTMKTNRALAAAGTRHSWETFHLKVQDTKVIVKETAKCVLLILLYNNNHYDIMHLFFYSWYRTLII